MINNSAPVQSKTLNETNRLNSQEHPLDKYSSALSAVPFTVALAASLAFFRLEGSRTALVFDSAHYFQSTELLYQALTGHFNVLKDLSLSLNLDGPVLPLLGGVVCLFTGQPPTLSRPDILIVAQCFLHAINSSLVFRLAKKLTDGGKLAAILTALGAALFFALSPAAVIATSRYLTETVTTTLLLLLTLSASRNFSLSNQGRTEPRAIPRSKSALNTFGFGVIAALLILSKTALAPITIGIAVLTFFAQRQSLRSVFEKLGYLVSGGAAVFVPWGLFNLIASGSLQLLPNRLPGWNIALGSDIETDGWSAIPIPALLDLNYFDKPLSIIYGIFYSHPSEYIGLTIRKAARLFWNPWNDFSCNVFPGIELSALIHQSILLIAFCGIFYSLIRNSRQSPSANQSEDATGLRLSLISAAVILGHLVFVPFEAIPRYAFSATPFLLLSSVFFLSRAQSGYFLKMWLPCLLGTVALTHVNLTPYLVQLKLSYGVSLLIESLTRSGAILMTLSIALVEMAHLTNNRKASQMTVLLGALSLIVCLSVGVAFGLNPRDPGEWKCTLNATKCAVRNVWIAENGLSDKPDFMALLIDAAPANLDQCKLTINGSNVPIKSYSIYDIPNPYRYQQTLLFTVENQAAAEGIDRDSLRQWRIVKVPLSSVGEGWNQIALSGPTQGEATIYGDYRNSSADTNRIHLPSMQAFAVCKVQAGLGPRDGRPLDTIGLPASPSNCHLIERDTQNSSRDLSGDAGEQTGTFRMFLLKARKKEQSDNSATTVDGMTFGNRTTTLY